MLPQVIQEELEQFFKCTIKSVQACGGGCINNAAVVSIEDSEYFIKWNQDSPPDTFHVEADSLKRLKESGALVIPEVVLVSKYFLLLEYLESGPEDWATLGSNLAKLHSVKVEDFGYDHNNYIGTLPQKNSISSNWGDFFVTKRLGYQLELACQKWASNKLMGQFIDVQGSVIRYLNETNPEPCLVHGDLWQGNIMFSSKGPALIDPACYFGVGEVDLAFLSMFGSAPTSFWEAYYAISPRVEGYETRSRIYNLYHELTHANMFGGSYKASAQNTIKFLGNI